MKKENYLSWESYFMSIAVLSSFRSKDPKTQTGACIVDSNKKIIGIGYNGLPIGTPDSDEYWNDSDDSDVENSKHTYVVHAEKNAIYNSMAHDLTGSTLYVTLFPCNICAQAIVQVGIKKVIYLDIKDHHNGHNNSVMKMFNNANIKVESFKELDIKDKGFIKKMYGIKP